MKYIDLSTKIKPFKFQYLSKKIEICYKQLIKKNNRIQNEIFKN